MPWRQSGLLDLYRYWRMINYVDAIHNKKSAFRVKMVFLVFCMVDIYIKTICSYGLAFWFDGTNIERKRRFWLHNTFWRKGSHMKLAICDDEKVIRKYIAGCVREVSEDIEIKLFEDAEGIISPEFDADILFLDIQMPGIDGMKAAEVLRRNGKKTVIVFVTALEEMVFNAFEVAAFRYIVKPFEKEKLIDVIKKSIDQAEEQQRQYAADFGNDKGKKDDHNVINIKSGGVNTSVVLSEVAFAEIYDRMIVLHMKDGDTLEYYGRISELEKIAGQSFFRIHRAYLINLKYIKSYDSKHVEITGIDIPVARGKYQSLVKAYLSFQTRREGL